MSLAMDWKLWEHLYYLEGWHTIPLELEQFEREISTRQSLLGQTKAFVDEHAHKKRALPGPMPPLLNTNDDTTMVDVDMDISPPPQPSLFGRTSINLPSGLNTGFGNHTGNGSRIPSSRPIGQIHETQKFEPRSLELQSLQSACNVRDAAWPSRSSGLSDLSFLSSLVIYDRRMNVHKLNWQYLYNQRRRLEANWEEEKYINFQLPHPDHLEEGHRECIYTIQHSGKYLVSGSRDMTLRIWNLDTRRMVGDPLRGHKGSVLCLQFDADPAEDLIVSGSSDSSVILWKFSTGKPIQSLKNAHKESVLNVRFDHRILVTCSKDKTIKIFNRRPLHPGDLGYPEVTQAVRPIPTVLNNYGFNPSPFGDLPVKPPYSLIGVLEGHGAAVNAVQIYKNEIVSASGDRHVKVWDWPLQTCTRTLIGHQKGIACVQYDGRRIVSGSSDNEVKVFDKETGLEVASLRAHTNLVRTVQAGFGDLPYSAEEDQEAARNVDYEYFKAVDSGAIPKTAHRLRTRNAGSRKPEDIMAYGAKLPPGGGGGRYGRIVSGSYDETIIIWRRDKEGVWKAQHILRQEDAAHAAAREFRVQRAPAESSATNLDDQGERAQNLAPNSQAYYQDLINQVVALGPAALRNALNQHPQLLQYSALQNTINEESTPALRNQLRSVVAGALARQQILLAQQLSAAGTAGQYTGQGTTAQSAAMHPAQASTGATTEVSNPVTIPPNGQDNNATTQPTAPNIPQPGIHPHLAPASMARVFKLQFDARRIICCSQTSTIVGWDFANGDEKITEASRFFAPIE
jgi:F-box and WD-40 domain protein 1/11